MAELEAIFKSFLTVKLPNIITPFLLFCCAQEVKKATPLVKEARPHSPLAHGGRKESLLTHASDLRRDRLH